MLINLVPKRVEKLVILITPDRDVICLSTLQRTILAPFCSNRPSQLPELPCHLKSELHHNSTQGSITSNSFCQ
uniref:Uncharacterized protein n=1 Tax=Tetranychus urticae TaxID=32264 RepID=T1JYP3_TETUR